MSTMMTKPTISIFGSTGGCGFALLQTSLKASYQATVLVRNQEKLMNLLGTKDIPSNLTVVVGSINDASAVQRALRTADGKLVDMVFSCIGFVPSMTPAMKSLSPFANVDDLNLCRNGTEAIVSAISGLKNTPEKGPLLVVLSTTGISSTGRDIPIAMIPFYHWMLVTPHKDKKAMEDYLMSSAIPTNQPWTVVRPSLLSGDGKGGPTGKEIRVGWERDGKIETPAIGYTIKRQDVGDWMFKNIVQGGGAARWAGKAVSLTY